MSKPIRFSMDGRNFRKDLKKLGAAVRGRTLARAGMAGGQVVEGYAKINANEVFSANATNTLAGSISTEIVRQTDMSVEVDVGPTVAYGRIHELGGVIKPVHGKYLAIPMNKTKSRPRDFSDLHFVPIEGGGSGLLISEAGSVKFFLTKVVHMRARPYLRPAVDEHTDEILQAMRFQLEKGLSEAV